MHARVPESTSFHHTGLVPRAPVRIALMVVGAFNAVSAVGGGIGLLTPGSMGAPVSMMAGSGFTSFLWPAVLLIAVIGGTQALAVVSEWRRSRLAPFWGAVAGFAMITWIFVELAIVHGFSILHGVFFATGVVQVALVLALLDVVPGLVRAEEG